MKTLLSIILLLLSSAERGRTQEMADKAQVSSAATARTSVEVQLMRAIGFSWKGDNVMALEIVRSLYGRADAEPLLILRAETAMCAVQAANRLDSWEGSDFGKATPWFGGLQGSLWSNWDTEAGGRVTIETGDDISIEYFDMIIEHSLKRLRRVSADGPNKKPDAEQGR